MKRKVRRKRFAVGAATQLIAISSMASAQAPGHARLQTPLVFEPGTISGPANDGAPTFSPDGATLLFEQSNSTWSTIVISHRKNGRWTSPEAAPFAGPSSDQQPAMSPDGSYVVYASSRTVTANTTAGAARKSVTSLFRVNRTASGWSVPVKLPDTVNISERVFKPSIASNGDIYFMSATASGADPKWRLFRSVHLKGSYSPAEPLAFSDGSHPDVDPFIAPDQSYIVFSSKGRGDPRDADHERLYLARRIGNAWGPVTAMRYAGDDRGYDDGEAQVGRDGKTLYFTSGRPGPFDRARSRAGMLKDLARLRLWDNGNNNVWTLSIEPYLEEAA